MDSRASALMTAQGGVLGSRQLTRLGIPPDEVSRWVVGGDLVRVRRGAFIGAAAWSAADRDERYRLTVAAAMRSRGVDEMASHHSALALHRLPLWHVDRDLVVLAADVQETTTGGGVRVMPLRALVDRVEVEGLAVMAVADAVVAVASVSVEAGVVAGDAAVHDGRCTEADLAEAASRLRRGLRGKARLRAALAHIDGASESPGESRTRLVLTALGLPVASQVVVCDQRGSFVARVDFLVAGRVVIEFDGAVKYKGADGAEVVVAEKRREDRLRELGYEVVRLTWDDLSHPERVLARVRAVLLRRAA
ncbi:hypothetical protein [Pedococcus aerophilus]